MKTDRVLLIVGQDMQFAPYVRIEYLARFLAKRFVEVDLISVTKMYDGPGTDPALKKGMLGIRDLFLKRVKTICTGNVVNYVVRFPRTPIILDYLTRDLWTYMSLGNRLDHHYDLCILQHPRLAYVAMRLKKLGKVDVFIYEDWDYYPGEFPNVPFWHQIMNYREQICVRSSDGVVSVGTGLEDLRKRQGARDTAVVSNGVDYALSKMAQQKKPHPPTILYLGSLGNEWGADLPIRALPLIREILPDVRYVILGSGSEEKKLRAMVSDLHLDDCVCFFGQQRYQDLPRFLAEADIGVAMSRDSEFRVYACPLKIFEYMAAGLPVIGSQFGETQLIIEKAKAGKTVEFSEQAFAVAVVDLLTKQSEYDVYSANAVTFAKAHDWEQLLDQEFAFIERVAQPVIRGMGREK